MPSSSHKSASWVEWCLDFGGARGAERDRFLVSGGRRSAPAPRSERSPSPVPQRKSWRRSCFQAPRAPLRVPFPLPRRLRPGGSSRRPDPANFPSSRGASFRSAPRGSARDVSAPPRPPEPLRGDAGATGLGAGGRRPAGAVAGPGGGRPEGGPAAGAGAGLRGPARGAPGAAVRAAGGRRARRLPPHAAAGPARAGAQRQLPGRGQARRPPLPAAHQPAQRVALGLQRRPAAARLQGPSSPCRISYDPGRFPRYLPEAYCLCRGCLTGPRGEEDVRLRSAPVLVPAVVLRRTPACAGGRAVYTEEYLTIPVGCTCMPGPDKDADGANSSLDKPARP
ncbi:interleukin-17D isoform X1 [Balaenoptera musculus]|uniref:Interleukin-17D isoform X1 n=1 Tax=Balaenoptera musculus TaxID=9771 RepID=A0A8B8VT55_BALMU|nr:interleukin-17D isoform X1 [Balaenoptera musculus]XP_036687871.1 interleukin-17D isoform X1 [Balaenoptera musculus]